MRLTIPRIRTRYCFAFRPFAVIKSSSIILAVVRACIEGPDNLHFRKLAIETCDNLGRALIVGSATEIFLIRFILIILLKV